MEFHPSLSKLCLWVCFVILQCHGCFGGCAADERAALLEIKASAMFADDYFSTWVEDKTSDYCAWERIKCSDTTGCISQLDLEVVLRGDSLLNASLFLPFKDLQYLDISYNGFNDWKSHQGFDKLAKLKKLQVLNLGSNYFNISVLQALSELASLKTLYLDGNYFGESSSSEISQGILKLSNLKNLEVLSLAYNELKTNILAPLGEITSLKTLYLDSNYIGEGLASEISQDFENLSKLKRLQCLDLKDNNLNDTSILVSLSKLTSLQNLNLSSNQLRMGSSIEVSQDMAPQGKSDASRIQWNSTMDEHLIGVLKEEHLTGGRHPDGTWKHDALAHAAKEVFDQTGEEVSVEHVRARRRYLQDKYKKARECKEKSGFGWNAATQLFTADSIAWKEFVTEHPKYKSFRSKQVPFYDDLDCIFGEEKVTGLRNFEGSESSAHVEPPLDDCDNGDDNEIQPSTSTSSMQTTTSGSRKKRRRMAESIEENMLMGMVEAAKEIAKALKPQKCDHIERALKQLPDMTDDQVFDGMDLLGPDPQLTEVFFGLSEDSSRKAWLMRRLKRQN